MKHKIFSLVLLLSICTIFPTSSEAADLIPSGLTADGFTVDGSYKGTMDVIIVKGKNYEPREATYVIEDGMLLCDFPQIGKMPGKIRIELPVEIHEDGTVTAEPESQAGLMKMPMGIKIKLRLSALKESRLEGNSLSFTLDLYGKFMGANFPTSVHFSGISE